MIPARDAGFPQALAFREEKSERDTRGAVLHVGSGGATQSRKGSPRSLLPP